MIFIPMENIERKSDEALADWVFPALTDADAKTSVILTVDNRTALRLNEYVLGKLENEPLRTFDSTDLPDKDNGLTADPSVFATETPSGMRTESQNRRTSRSSEKHFCLTRTMQWNQDDCQTVWKRSHPFPCQQPHSKNTTSHIPPSYADDFIWKGGHVLRIQKIQSPQPYPVVSESTSCPQESSKSPCTRCVSSLSPNTSADIALKNPSHSDMTLVHQSLNSP